MKDKNLSLARKILLALLAVLMAVGAFFGVVSLKRGGLVSSVDGALTASAEEADPSDTTTDNTAWGLGQLKAAYKAIKGIDIDIAEEDGTVSATKGDITADLETLNAAVTEIKASGGQLHGANERTGVNEVLQDKLKVILQSAFTENDSAAIRNYMSFEVAEGTEGVPGIIQKFDAKYAEKDDNGNLLMSKTQIDIAADVLTDTNDAHQSVAEFLQTTRSDERTAATTLYNKVREFLGFVIPESETLPWADSPDCNDVNTKLKTAFNGLLTTGVDSALVSHYTALNTTIGGKIDEANNATNRKAASYSKDEGVFAAVLDAEQDRLGEWSDETSAYTANSSKAVALSTFTTFCGDADVTTIETTLKGALGAIELTAEGTVNDALDSVNDAFHNAINAALLTLLQKGEGEDGAILDSTTIETFLKTEINFFDTTVNALTGLSALKEDASTLSAVSTTLTEKRDTEKQTAETAYSGYQTTLGVTVSATIEGANIVAVNTSLGTATKALVNSLATDASADVKALLDAVTKDGGTIDSEVSAANAARKAVDLSGIISGLKTALDAQNAEEVAAAKEVVIKAYNDLFGTNYTKDSEDIAKTLKTALETITGTTVVALNNTIQTAVEGFLTERSKVDGVVVDNLKAITDVATTKVETLVTTANSATAEHVPALVDLTGANLAKVKSDVELRIAKNNDKAELATWKGTVTAACGDYASDVNTAVEAAVTTANGNIDEATTIDAVHDALADGKDAVLAAASLGIAKKQYADSYKAIKGAEDDGLETAVNGFKTTLEALEDPTPAGINDALKNAILALLPKATEGSELKTAVEKITSDVEAVVAGTEDEGTEVYKNVFNYAEALNGAKDELDLATAKDAAIKAVSDKLTELEGTLKDSMAADDWSALPQLADNYKKEIADLTEIGQVESKKTAATGTLEAIALRYVAKQEYIESITAITGVTAPTSAKVEAFMTAIKELTTAQTINNQLKISVSADAKELLKDDSKEIYEKLTYCLNKIDISDTGKIADISAVFADADEDETNSPLSTYISNIRGKEKDDAKKLYKEVYAKINNVEDANTLLDAIVPDSIKSATNCKGWNDALKAEIGKLLVGTEDAPGGLLADHVDDSNTVKGKITTAKTEIDTLFDNSNKDATEEGEATRQIPEGVTEKITTLLSGIQTQIETEQGKARDAYKKFYHAIKEADPSDIEGKFSDATTLKAINAALQTAMNDLVDAYKAEKATEATDLEAVVTTLKADIGSAFNGLVEVMTDTVAETLGDEVKSLVAFELYRVANLKKVNDSYDAVKETAGMSEGGAAALLARYTAAVDQLATEGETAIKVEKKGTGTWTEAYSTAKGNVDALIAGLKIDTKGTSGFDVFTQIAKNAVVEQEYIDSYLAINGTKPETDEFKTNNLGQNYEKDMPVPGLNTALQSVITGLLTNLKEGQTTATQQAIETQIAEKINKVNTDDGKIGDYSAAAEAAMEEIKTAIGKDIGFVKGVYVKAYNVIMKDNVTELGDEKVKAAVDAIGEAKNCSKATDALATALSTLITGLKATSDSTTVTSFIDNFAKAVSNQITASSTTIPGETFTTEQTFSIDGGTVEGNTYTLTTAVEEIGKLRNAGVSAAVAEYLEAYKAATGDNAATEETSAVKEFKDSLTGKNVQEANGLLKTAVKALLNGLLEKDGETVLDSKEVQKIISDAKDDVDNAAAEDNGVSNLDNIVTNAKNRVNTQRGTELAAAKGEYEAFYLAMTGSAATDSATVFAGANNVTALNNKLKELAKGLLGKLLVTQAATEAEAPAVVLDAQEIKDYLSESGVASGLIDANTATVSEGSSVLDFYNTGDTPSGVIANIIKAVNDKRAEEKLAAINAYLAVYAEITGVQLEYKNGELSVKPEASGDVAGAADHEDVQAVITAINEKTNATDANTALTSAVTKLVEGYVTNNDSKAAQAKVEALALPTEVGNNGIVDSTALVKAATDVKGEVDKQRGDERAAVVSLYVSIYNALNGTNKSEDNLATELKGIKDAVDMHGFNDALNTAVQAILTSISQSNESKAVKDYVATLGTSITNAIGAANDGTSEDGYSIPTLGNDFDIGEDQKGTFDQAKTELEAKRNADHDTAIDAYKAAYKAITGYTVTAGDDGVATSITKDGTEVEGAVKAYNDVVATLKGNATELNNALKAGVVALVNGLVHKTDGNTTDSQAVQDIVSGVVTKVNALGATGDLVVIDTDALTAALMVGDGEESATVKAAVEAQRAKEITGIQAAFEVAYEALTGYTVEITDGQITIMDGETTIDNTAFTEAYNALGEKSDFGTAIDALKDSVGGILVLLYDAPTEGESSKDSKSINDYMDSVKGAVSTGISGVTDVSQLKGLTFTIGEATGQTFGSIKTTLDGMRAAEVSTAVNAYKAAYDAIKGGAPADDDDTLTKLNAAKNATELNNALKAGVKALVEALKNETDSVAIKGSEPVKGLVPTVLEQIDAAFTMKELAVVGADALTNATDGALYVTVGEDKVAIKTAVENQRAADITAAKQAYVDVYNALTGKSVEVGSDDVKDAIDAIGKATNFVDANNALKTQVDNLIASIRNTETDSTNVSGIYDVIKSAIDKAIQAAINAGTSVNIEGVKVKVGEDDLTISEAKKKLDDTKTNEFNAAKEAYVEAYNLVMNMHYALDKDTHQLPADAPSDLTAALSRITGSDIKAVNDKLIEEVQTLIEKLYKEDSHTQEVHDYLFNEAGKVEGSDTLNAKGLIAFGDPGDNGLNDVVDAVEKVIAAVAKIHDDEIAAIVEQYLNAYTTLVDATATNETKAVKDFSDSIQKMTTGAANDKLLEEVQGLLDHLLTLNDKGEIIEESDAMKGKLDDYLTDESNDGFNGKATPDANTGVSNLADAIKAAQDVVTKQRGVEKGEAKAAYIEAYRLLMGVTEADVGSVFDAALGSKDYNMAELINLLAEQVGLIVEESVKLPGDSAAVKDFLGRIKTGVENEIKGALDTLAIPDMNDIKVRVDGQKTLAEVREALDEMRVEERNAGKNLYKTYFKAVMGVDYTDRDATDADKKVMEDLDKATDNATVNEIIKKAVSDLINNRYITSADGKNVTDVATKLEEALGVKFDDFSGKGELAGEELADDIKAILVAIDLRREQDTTIGEVNAAYDAIETARLEAAAKEDLDKAKADALAAIEEVTLGEGTVADAAKVLDGILTTAIDALNRKAAEGIAKQEYLDSYKNITGADATDTKAVFDAITEAAKQSGYTVAVNGALRDAVSALLDGVLVRDEKNVLKDSQETKAIVEAARKTVRSLTQSTAGVPDVSEAVKSVKGDVEAQRKAEKDAAIAAIDAAVAGKTYTDAVKTGLDLATLTAAAKTKAENGNYAELSAAAAQIKGQVALLDFVAALEGKVGFAEAMDAVKAASATIGGTATAVDAEKASARGLLDAQKALAKAQLKDLVKNESSAVKGIVDEYNAKIDSATSAEAIEAVLADAQLAVAAGRFLDSYSVLRKSFASIKGGDKAALEAALVAFKNLAADSEAKLYLNSKTKYTSYEDEIADMIAKSDLEAAKAEAIEGVKALAANKTGSYMQKVANSQIAKINAVTYQPQMNAAERSTYLQERKDAVAKALSETGVLLESAETVQKAENKMNDLLEEYLASGNYQGKTKENLENVLKTYLARAEEEGVTDARLDAIYEEAKAALDAANVSTVGSGVALENGDYAEDYEGTALYGTVTTDSDSGLAKSTIVSIEKKDGSLTMDTVKSAADSGKLKAAAGTSLTQEQMKALVDGKEVITTLDIIIASYSATAESGLYTVRVLLPEDLRNVENIAVVYAAADGSIEVFDAQVTEDGYLTFTTDHFSEFVVLGEGSVNLWWLVITLTVVLALELVALLVVLLKKNKKSSTTVASVLPIGLLALVVPMNATGICILLGVCVVGMGVGIFFAARHKKKANQK